MEESSAGMIENKQNSVLDPKEDMNVSGEKFTLMQDEEENLVSMSK